ncbi:uncharacterized protein PHALS_08041 [Plasmopara halstedii]|uniref:Uncharacterized protein n=1 Tax=Plasmopara halstedii TaxID=4781 RepID=A0A0P1B716_PLAHL|nr:uncharacterized protein PHALS_08041 [Plasmopara halstedii]CEG50322.1 hypothetical protein PHALS_08041 [Plasmopara halstedii]|eukprot:XP_024586691.1 hypothetical protein PHALS_08041 [Plasmopara halstedii]
MRLRLADYYRKHSAEYVELARPIIKPRKWMCRVGHAMVWFALQLGKKLRFSSRRCQ